MDKKARKTRKEKVRPREETEEEYADRHLGERIKRFENLKSRVLTQFEKIPTSDQTPPRQKSFYALCYVVFNALEEIYEILAVVNKDLFTNDSEHIEIDENLRALGRHMKRPEYKHIEKLLMALAKMEKETRNRPIDSMMYKG